MPSTHFEIVNLGCISWVVALYDSLEQVMREFCACLLVDLMRFRTWIMESYRLFVGCCHSGYFRLDRYGLAPGTGIWGGRDCVRT